MKINRMLLASAAVIALCVPALNAFAADKETYESNTQIEKDRKGNFSEKSKTSKTDLNGTFSSFEKEIRIEKNDGVTDKTTTTESTVDPNGLGNKRVIKTKDTEKNKNGEISSTHDASVDGKSVESDSSFKKDANGNYERKDSIVRTDAAGTTRSSETKTDVRIDAGGNVNKVTTTEESVDPKGWGNKTDKKTTDTEKTTMDGSVVEKSTQTDPTR
jgi:hypothetical protein